MVRHVGFPPIYMPFGRVTPAQQELRELEERRRKIVELGMKTAELRDRMKESFLERSPPIRALEQAVRELHLELSSVDRDIEALRHQTR